MIDKKKIAHDWENAFPHLTQFAKDKFYRTIGPLIVGIELIKLPKTEAYRPHFIIYALWGNKGGNDVKACLLGPILIQQFYNKKGLQFDIPYEKHDIHFEEMVGCIKKQLPVKLDCDVSLKEFFYLLDEYSKKPPLSASSNSYLQAALKQYKLYSALYAKDTIQANNVFTEAKTKNWDVKHFILCNVQVEDWINGLKQTMLKPDTLMSIITNNLNDDKIKRLKRSELIR